MGSVQQASEEACKCSETFVAKNLRNPSEHNDDIRFRWLFPSPRWLGLCTCITGPDWTPVKIIKILSNLCVQHINVQCFPIESEIFLALHQINANPVNRAVRYRG